MREEIRSDYSGIFLELGTFPGHTRPYEKFSKLGT